MECKNGDRTVTGKREHLPANTAPVGSNSPDINGDLIVDLTNIVIFTTHIGVGCD